ncbi:MAG: AGZA family xanthine/uracil permease-like MFS transporter [Myxococcota bacterium]
MIPRQRVSVEVRAGFTTFLTMAYILFVNPSILGNAIVIPGVDVGPQLLSATALAAGIGSIVMGLWARYPFALAPGMGLNAYFAFSVVLGQGIAWQAALGAVFLSGICFLVLSLVGVRELVVNAIPAPLQSAIACGIGAFLAFIGLQQGGIIVADPNTLVTLGNPATAGPALTIGGVILVAVLQARGIRGGVLLGIAAISALAIVTGAAVFQGQPFGGFTHGVVQAPVWPTDLFLALDIPGALDIGFFGIVFVFLFVDFFDTAGTLIGLSQRAPQLTDDQGRLERATQAFGSDAIATACGALLGTSTTTSYIESAAGIEEGGRTGTTALVVGALFFLSLFLWPLAGAVPAVATAPALIVVGALMMRGASDIAWTQPEVAVPAFLTIVGMPFSFSIATGISLGLISWVVIHAGVGKARQVHWLLWLLSALLVARFIWLA